MLVLRLVGHEIDAMACGMKEGSRRSASPRVLFGVTASVTAHAFLRGKLAYFVSLGWDVHLLCGDGVGLEELAKTESVTLHVVPTGRDPHVSDLIVLFKLWRTIRQIGPNVCICGTPKIGILGTVAAAAARVPVRVFVVHGLRWETMGGFGRILFQLLDRLACLSATDVVAVSEGVRARLVEQGLAREGRAIVLGHGSASGIDVDRFAPANTAQSKSARKQLGLPAEKSVVAFVGRLTGDKGLVELVSLWESLLRERPDVWLIVVGIPEPTNRADSCAIRALERLPQVSLVRHTERMETVYSAADLLLVLSKREGMSTVILEAAAAGIPTVGLNATGVTDAVIDGQTGWLFAQGDLSAVLQRISDLLDDPALARSTGKAARELVVKDFRQQVVWARWEAFLSSRLANDGVNAWGTA